MMANLAVQLGHDNDTSLTTDVMDQLIQNRLQELKDSVQSIQGMTMTDSVPSEWEGFVQSLLSTLKEEEANLKAI